MRVRAILMPPLFFVAGCVVTWGALWGIGAALLCAIGVSLSVVQDRAHRAHIWHALNLPCASSVPQLRAKIARTPRAL